jgi:DNA polymerase-3 subunit alpha
MQTSNQVSLFGAKDLKMPEIQLVSAAPADKKERLAWEKELLGLYISDHPAKEYQKYFEETGTLLKNIDSGMAGRNINVGGVITKIQKIITRSQQAMLFVTLEDMDTKIEVLVFPKILESTGSIWEEGKVILAGGRLSDKDGQMKLLAENAKVISQKEVENFQRVLATQKKNGDAPKNNHRPPNASPSMIKDASSEEDCVFSAKKLLVEFPGSFDKKILKDLAALLDRCQPGETRVYLKIGQNKLETPYSIKKTGNLLDRLNSLVPNARIEFL